MANFKFYDYEINDNAGVIVNTDSYNCNIITDEFGNEAVTWIRNDFETITLNDRDCYDLGVEVEFVKDNDSISIWKDKNDNYYTTEFDDRNNWHVVADVKEFATIEVILKLQLLDAVDYQNDVRFDLDEVAEVQESAVDNTIDFFNKLNSVDFIDNEDFQGDTNLNEGYTESVIFTIKTHLNKDSLEKELEKLREKIDYAYIIQVVE